MKILLSVAVLLSFIVVSAQPRFTDSTFGTNGKVVENTSIPDVDILDALLQPDGKTLTLAASKYNDTTRTVLIRYNSDGTPDAGFSSDGIADSLITPSEVCNPKAVKLQPDGKIVVCGHTGDYSNIHAFVMRYNADGSLDASFGSNGILYLPLFTFNGASFELPAVENMALLPGGKVTLLSVRNYPYYDIALVRINSNGTIDSSFGTNGIVLVNPLSNTSNYKQYTHIEVLANGKYIVGGKPYTTSSSGASQTYIVVRINANGTLDNTYGINGSVLLTGGPTIDGLEDLVIQQDGKILIGGSESLYATCTYICLQRITTAGTLDATFGSGGKQIIQTLATGFVALKTRISLQADGKILIGGRAKNSSGNYTMAAARLTTTGLFDTSFDGDGVALLQVNEYNSYGYTPLQQGDGKIVITGLACSTNSTLITIGRFTATGQTDATLNAATVASLLNNGSAAEWGVDVMIQPADQKIVSVRERTNGFDFDIYVSRHLPNGQPDTSFGINGKTYLSIPGYLFYIRCSGLSADGKITVITYFLNFTTYDFITYGTLGIYRLKANGQPDSSFGQYGKKIFESRTTDTVIDSHTSPVIQPDGKIIVAARRYKVQTDGTFTQDSSFLLRLNNDGSYNNSFNTSRSASPSQDIQLALQTDGKILTTTGYIDSATYITRIRRLNADGNPDVTFNNGSDRILNFRLSYMMVQPSSKIVLSSQENSVIRLLSNGNFDSTFGTNGTVDASGYYDSNNENYISNIVADSNHILLLATLQDSTSPNYPYSKMVALNDNGSPDSSFGQLGVLVPDFSPNGYGSRMALQAGNKIVVVGATTTTNKLYISDFALTRLKSGSTTGRLYTFTGSGLWSNPANWSDGTVPPTIIPAGSSIIIDPPTGSECVIDITVHVQAGASVTVRVGKQVRLPGNLIIQ